MFIINFVTWSVFTLDTLLAIDGWFRVLEHILHTLGFAGGGLGGVFGMLSGWHKIRKIEFITKFILSSLGGSLGKGFFRHFRNVTADQT